MKRIRLAPLLLLAAPVWISACDSGNGQDDPVRRAFVTRIVIDEFPALDPATGEGWDGGSATSTSEADLYFRILGSGGLSLLNGEESDLVTTDGQAGSRHFRNAGPADLPVGFTVNDFLIDALDRSLAIELKDDDSDVLNADDVIGLSISFRLEDHIPDPLPADRRASIPFESADGLVRGRMTVRFST